MANESGSILQYIVRGRLAGQTCLNVLHFTKIGEEGPDGWQALCQDFLDTLEGATAFPNLLEEMRNCTTEQYEFVAHQAQFIYPIRRPVVGDLLNVTGVLESTSNTANVAAVITKTSDRAGRKYIGSFHLAGVPFGDLGDGVWNAGYKVALSNLAAAIRQPVDPTLGGAGYVPVLFHANDTPPTADEVIGTKVQDTARVMRRRTVGLGI